MALAGGLHCIDHLSMRFSLHGLEDSYARQPTFCLSWSEPFHLDTVERNLTRRSHSLPTKLTAKISERNARINASREKDIKQKTKHQSKRVNLRRVGSSESPPVCRPQTRPCMKYANAPSASCKEFDEESSDEELCELMAERENIPCTKDSQLDIRGQKDANNELEMYERRQTTTRRKRYLEERDSFSGNEAKRPRPRLDFDKVRLSRTTTIEHHTNTATAVGTFAPIVTSDSEE